VRFLYVYYYLVLTPELEIEREEREAKERAIKEKADMDRQVGAQERAFQVPVVLVRWPCVLTSEAGCTFRKLCRGRTTYQRVQSRR
jgi:hypothetical protein